MLRCGRRLSFPCGSAQNKFCRCSIWLHLPVMLNERAATHLTNGIDIARQSRQLFLKEIKMSGAKQYRMKTVWAVLSGAALVGLAVSGAYAAHNDAHILIQTLSEEKT